MTAIFMTPILVNISKQIAWKIIKLYVQVIILLKCSVNEEGFFKITLAEPPEFTCPSGWIDLTEDDLGCYQIIQDGRTYIEQAEVKYQPNLKLFSRREGRHLLS